MANLNDVLLSWAVTLSGYPAPGVAPVVEQVSHAELVTRVCAGQEPCNALATLLPDEDKILVDDRLRIANDTESQSILVHEFVHYLQQRAGKMRNKAMSCEERVALEREAYVVQSQFAAEHGSGSHTAAMAFGLLPRICERPSAEIDLHLHP